MAFFKSLLIASVAAVAFAAPQGGASDKVRDLTTQFNMMPKTLLLTWSVIF